jgi:hypothetical protein
MFAWHMRKARSGLALNAALFAGCTTIKQSVAGGILTPVSTVPQPHLPAAESPTASH